MIKAISLGWGVQSWTLAAMVALGKLPPVDMAIHADTGWESSGTYEFAAQWQEWLEGHGVPVITVRPSRNNVVDERDGVPMPVYLSGGGRLQRQCTRNWKIAPMRRALSKELKRRGEKQAEVWLGISTDEWHRASDSRVRYIIHKYPLLDLGMSRTDCYHWLRENGLPVPPRSACTFCPFCNNSRWEEKKRRGGHDWGEAVMVDNLIRNAVPDYGEAYLHRSQKPLAEAVVIPEDFGFVQEMFLKLEDDGAGQYDIPDEQCDSGYCFL